METGRDHPERRCGRGHLLGSLQCPRPLEQGQAEEVCLGVTRFLSDHKLGGLKL